MASLTGLRADSGRRSLVMGLVRVDIAMSPMFDSKAQSRPTRNKICPVHKTKVNQKWWCEECKALVAAPTHAVEHEGRFIETDDSEWKALESLSSHELKLAAWVPEIDPRAFENSYNIWPDNIASIKNYKLLMILLEKRGGQLVGVTTGDHGTAKMFVVRYDEEQEILTAHVCKHQQYLRAERANMIKSALLKYEKLTPSEEEIELGEQVLGMLPESFDPSEVEDTLGVAQTAYVKAKAAGLEPSDARAAEEVEVVDLQEQLRATLAQAQIEPKKRASTKGGSKKRAKAKN